jgi:hypothetical protein
LGKRAVEEEERDERQRNERSRHRRQSLQKEKCEMSEQIGRASPISRAVDLFGFGSFRWKRTELAVV